MFFGSSKKNNNVNDSDSPEPINQSDLISAWSEDDEKAYNEWRERKLKNKSKYTL
jgi:hypothetical protein